MRTTRVIKYVFIATVITVLFFSIRYTNRLGRIHEKNRFDNGFTGVITKKIRQRGDIIYYRDVLTNDISEIYASEELNINSEVGDTIVKLRESNKCIIKSKSKRIIVRCFFDNIYENQD